ncbi:DUF58 domain-containing protein [Desulfoscipio sp. XC116]|uniref:DUF58 domain-containing protein n=1 Tax=Desulfoscipio sp. XC116 TaxID=3144975 RepID=UPI00325BB012
MNKQFLLESQLLSRLEGYRLVRQRPVTDGYVGARRSTAKGGSVEFADYREYTAGDEPRRVDWKAYARLGRLYVKEFRDERQEQLLFLIDTSASMDWGEGESHKGHHALCLAAGLGTCALAGHDRLSVAAGADADVRVCSPMTARRSLPRLWNWLGEISFGGVTDLSGCLRIGINAMPGATGLYVLSDLLDTAGVEEMLRLAAGHGMAVTLLHTLAPDELEPQGDGELTLVDAETGARVDVSLTPGVLRDYADRLEQLCGTLDQSCRRWGARRLLINTGRPPAEILLYTLPGLGVLKK